MQNFKIAFNELLTNSAVKMFIFFNKKKLEENGKLVDGKLAEEFLN